MLVKLYCNFNIKEESYIATPKKRRSKLSHYNTRCEKQAIMLGDENQIIFHKKIYF